LSAFLNKISEVIVSEQAHGAKVANRLRYVIFCAALLLILSLQISGRYFNGWDFAYLSIFLAVTFFHTIVLRRSSPSLASVLDYVIVILDYLVLAGMNYVYTINNSPDNFSFAIKSSVIYYLFLPFALTVFQFRIRLIIFALAMCLAVYTAFLIPALLTAPYTTRYAEFYMGPGIVVSEVLLSRPIAFISVGLCLIYAIFRSRVLAEKIARKGAEVSALTRYFSNDVAAEITGNPFEALRPVRLDAAILFLDIRGFTSMSEKMSPDDLASFLGEFRALVVDEIFRAGGSIDKFLGDGVLATFGIPASREKDHRIRAVDCALSILNAVDAYNRTAGHGREEIKIGIGIHAGDVIAGNITSGSRVEYTVLGDVVNTASRIESLCKTHTSSLLVSGEALLGYPDPAKFKIVGSEKIRGKKEEITLFRPAS